MATFLARRACQNLVRTRLAASVVFSAHQNRLIHITSVVQKKKTKGAAPSSPPVLEDDLFGDGFNPAEDDLFKEIDVAPQPSPTEVPTSSSQSDAQPTAKSRSKPKKSSLTPEERRKRFEAYMDFVSPRLGRRPEVPNPRVKKRSLLTLLQLAQNKEDLERVVELLPKWMESGREVLPYFAEGFVRRCHELFCPTLAITVFGNYSKYQLSMTLPAGQWLLHSLASSPPSSSLSSTSEEQQQQQQHPIEQLMIATSLYPVYNLPAISDDLVSAVIVAERCLRHGTKESEQLTEELRGSVERLLSRLKQKQKAMTEGSKVEAQAEVGRKAAEEEDLSLSQGDKREARKKLKWVRFALHNLNKAYEKRTGKPYVKPELIPSSPELRLDVVGGILRASTTSSASESAAPSAAMANAGATSASARSVEARV